MIAWIVAYTAATDELKLPKILFAIMIRRRAEDMHAVSSHTPNVE